MAEEAGNPGDYYEALHGRRGASYYFRGRSTAAALLFGLGSSCVLLGFRGSPGRSDIIVEGLRPSQNGSGTRLELAAHRGCTEFTDGTCWLQACAQKRGPSYCYKSRCRCMPGYCANTFGGCVSKSATCEVYTGGNCVFFGCDSSRGPTICSLGKCMCKEGTCANHMGVCVGVDEPEHRCPVETGGFCRWLGCDTSRGPTTCINSQCLCANGYCAVAGKCVSRRNLECPLDTGGTCRFFGCYLNRGPTVCKGRQCLCREGYCAEDFGSGGGFSRCVLAKGQESKNKTAGSYRAYVAPVSHRHPNFPAPHDNVKTAVCFSGGGARALTWALGAYRALEDLGLIRDVDAISCVSGGCWASAIFMFAKMDTKRLLGDATTPEGLTEAYLDSRPAELGATVAQSLFSFATNLRALRIPQREMWIQFIAEFILKPFGLNDRYAFMANSREEVQRIQRDNPDLAKMKFMTPAKGRPKVFVMGGHIGPPIGFKDEAKNAIYLHMSPDYVGSPFFPNGTAVPYVGEPGLDLGSRREDVGGGFLEAFAFGGPAPEREEGFIDVAKADLPIPDEPFSLAKAVAISSFAPSTFFANYDKQLTCTLPEVRLWPIDPEEDHERHYFDRIHSVGDGGEVENTGVIAMIQRGARRIAMWVSTYVPLTLDYDFCKNGEPKDGYRGAKLQEQVDIDFASLFGVAVDLSTTGFLSHNQVFPTARLAPLLCELQKLKGAGKPLVHHVSLTTQENHWWHIEGGREIELIINYADYCGDFQAKLSDEARSKIRQMSSWWHVDYPYYETGIFLNNAQVNLLAAQAEYQVRENRKLYEEFLR